MASAFGTGSTQGSASIAPQLEWQTSRAYTALSGALVGFEGSQWSAQGQGDVSLLFAPFGAAAPARGELVAVVGGTYHSSDFRTATSRAEARFHLAGRFVGGWLGAVGATGWSSSDSGFVTALGPTAGAWARYGTVRATLIATPLRQEGVWFPEVDARASWAVGPADLLAYGGWRGASSQTGIDAALWGGVSASFWASSRAAVVLAAGTYPPDLLQGLPQVRYLSAGLRLAGRRPAVPSVKAVGRPVYETEGGVRRIRFHLPDATSVNIVGDWTSWQPIQMSRAPGGDWLLQTDLPRGVYRFNLVVDGKRWVVPAGVTAIDDGYGGRTGLLIVP